MKNLPKKLFVAIQEGGTEDEFLQCDTDVGMLVGNGEKKKVGIYELKEERVAVNKTTLTEPLK